MEMKFRVETLRAGDIISTREGNFEIYRIFQSYFEYIRFFDRETRSITPSTLNFGNGMYATGKYKQN